MHDSYAYCKHERTYVSKEVSTTDSATPCQRRQHALLARLVGDVTEAIRTVACDRTTPRAERGAWHGRIDPIAVSIVAAPVRDGAPDARVRDRAHVSHRSDADGITIIPAQVRDGSAGTRQCQASANCSRSRPIDVEYDLGATIDAGYVPAFELVGDVLFVLPQDEGDKDALERMRGAFSLN